MICIDVAKSLFGKESEVCNLFRGIQGKWLISGQESPLN